MFCLSFLFVSYPSASASMSNVTRSIDRAAIMSAVYAQSFLASRLAPRSTRLRTILVKPRPAARINGGFKLLHRWHYQAGHLIKRVEVAMRPTHGIRLARWLRMRGVAYVIYPTSIAMSLEH